MPLLSFCRTVLSFVISTNVEKSGTQCRQKGVDRAMRLDFSAALEMTGVLGSTELYS